MRSIGPWRYTTLPPVMSPTSLTTSTSQRLLKWSSSRKSGDKDTESSYLWRGTRRWDHRKSAVFTTCSLRSKKNQRTWDKLITLMKKVCCQLHHFSHTQEREDPCTNSVHEVRAREKPSREMENENNQDSPWKTKEQILADFRAENQKHEFQADSDRRSIQESTGIIDSQRMEIDHTITGCEQSRRDQLLLQEEMSEKIRNMRDMEGIAEKSRVKGRGTYKKKIDWRLWGSNFILLGLGMSRQSTSLATTTRSTQRLRSTTSTPGIRWLHQCTFRREKQVRAFCRLINHKEKACFNVHSQKF